MKQLILFACLCLIGAGTARADFSDNPEDLYERAGNCDDSLVRGSPEMLKALRQLKETLGGRKPTLTSCFRSQDRQNAIRASLRCGQNNCRGRSAKVSQHTVGVAVDVRLPGMQGQAVCEVLARVRDSALGHGGVGAYADGTGHLDLRPSRCGWNRCSYLGCSNEYISPTLEQYLLNANVASTTFTPKDAG